MKKRTSNPTLIERIRNLSLIQNDYFNYAVQNSIEFVKALIDPVLHYLGIKDYEIISVEPQKNISNGLNRDVIYDCLIKLKNSSFIIIEIQNTNSDRMTIKRIRFEQSFLIPNS